MQKTCTQCSAPFEITDDDLKFYNSVSPTFAGKKYSVPPPKMCPECRFQRRLMFRNDRNFYHRKSDYLKPAKSLLAEAQLKSNLQKL